MNISLNMEMGELDQMIGIWCSEQGVSSHGKLGKVMEFHFLFSGLENPWKLKGILLQNGSFLSPSISILGYLYVSRSNFGVFHVFLYYDWNLVCGSQRQNRPVASAGAHGLGTCLFHATKHVKGP